MSKHACTGVHWIIQNNRSDALAMSALVEKAGHAAHLVDLVPFSPDIPAVAGVPDDAPVICWGAGFVPRAAAHPSWRPGIFFDEASFRWSAFRAAWGGLVLNDDAEVRQLGEALAELDKGGHAFVRPDADNKAFESGVHTAASLREAVARSRMPDGSRAGADLPVVVARPRDVVSEYRMFVVDGDVVAASSYRHLGVPNVDAFIPHAAIVAALDAAALWMPAPVACLDVGVDDKGRMGVVEANCFNAARLYAADAAEIVAAVSDHAARARRAEPPSCALLTARPF
jgi:hypothetical protein